MSFSSSNREISIKSGFLNVDGSPLRTAVLDIPNSIEVPVFPDEFEQILRVGRTSIAIASFYRLWVIRLGNTDQTDGSNNQVYTPLGYKNGGVHEFIDEIQDPFHAYWRAIEAVGFKTEVRSTTGDGVDGSWMLLGK